MKHIIFVLFFVAMGFNCIAQSNKGLDNNEVNKVKKELVNQVINPMRKTADQLLRDINNAQALYDRLKDRHFSMATSTLVGEGQLEEYLSQFSFDDLFEAEEGKWFVKQDVVDVINNELDSDLKRAYLLALDMKKSLNEPYNEETNNQYIKEAAKLKEFILPSHTADFEKLVSQINDYNYYMFELARLFVAADEDKYRKTLEELVKDEDAPYLLDVPYTKTMLQLYISRKKAKQELTPQEKAELKAACSDAFPDF